jgi:hypothetical protein
VMCANHGHFALMLNFFCSLRAAGIETPKHFIVTTSVETEQMLTGMGLTAFYHKGLGEFPTKASDGYGDETFVRMMMLKQFAVYVALLCRYVRVCHGSNHRRSCGTHTHHSSPRALDKTVPQLGSKVAPSVPRYRDRCERANHPALWDSGQYLVAVGTMCFSRMWISRGHAIQSRLFARNPSFSTASSWMTGLATF